MIEQRSVRIVGLIPARCGSKGLPRKNTRLLKGMPLYKHSLNISVECLDHTIVSTDDREIIEQCTDLVDVSLVQRPSSLATDDTNMVDVILHAISAENLSDEIIVLLQPTSPFRQAEDIAEALDLFLGNNSFSMVMSVSQVESKILKSGFISESGAYLPLRYSSDCFSNRQSLPLLYSPNGSIYIFSALEFVRSGGFPADNIGGYVMTFSKSLDIDNEDDFSEAEQVFNQY